jgi:hypothetical protein
MAVKYSLLWLGMRIVRFFLALETGLSYKMILVDDKTGSTEVQAQTELLSQPSSQNNTSEPTDSSLILNIPISYSHESLQEATAQPPPTYSPSVVSREQRTRMFVTNGRPVSTTDLLDSSASTADVGKFRISSSKLF